MNLALNGRHSDFTAYESRKSATDAVTKRPLSITSVVVQLFLAFTKLPGTRANLEQRQPEIASRENTALA